MSSFNSIFFSLLGGVLPALLWLWFWLKEDQLHPEPKVRIVAVFLAGMASVFAVLPLEKLVYAVALSSISLITVVTWASIEEISKYIIALFTALKYKVTDEPIDVIIYMITAALGFSALENTLFIFNLINSGLFSQSIITGSSRFLGATLLHVASSAAIGVMIALSYYKKPYLKKIFLLTGIILSVLLHTIFNLLIIKLGSDLFFVFAGIWILIILLIVLIEKVKKINP
jgi:RsiW-degrading membrane proteinase PrsW (M82 family)